MKKFIVVAAVAVSAMVISPAMAGLWWQPGDPGTTYQKWDFTIVSSAGAGYTSDPEVVDNPNLDVHDLVAQISPVYQGNLTYDQITGFWGNPAIAVDLEIPNYENPNLYKEIWVDLGDGLMADAIVPAGHDGASTTFTIEVLPGEGIWEFGVRIWPNPEFEKIAFNVISATGAEDVYLDYIEVWTICTPEPATLALLGLGSLLLRRKK